MNAIIWPQEWTFGIGDAFHWEPFGTNLRLINMEGGTGWFVEVKGFDGPVIDGSTIWEWPLDQYKLQELHIRRVGRPR